MSKKNKTKRVSKKEERAAKLPPVLKNPLALTVVLTLLVLIIFGAIGGSVIGVRNSRALISHGGTRVEASAAAYLATTYKSTYLNYLWRNGVLYADDTTEFWAEEADDGVTYGEHLRHETEQYLRQIVAGAYQFDRNFTLSKEDKRLIKDTALDLLSNVAGGDKRRFNEIGAPMGFDYNGFVDAITLLYKSEQAQLRLYGNGGSVLASGAYPAECNKYYSTFAYTKLLFIRTDYEYETDEKGEYIRDEGGNYVTRPLTNEEKSERETDIAEIRAAIRALEEGGDDQMNEGFFNSMLARYNFDDYTLTGYFFAPAASYTQGFASEVSAEVVDEAYGMQIGEFSEVDTEYGLCFIYRGEPVANGYKSSTYEVFFSDFYSDASNYLYLDAIVALSESVKIKDKYYDKIDIVTLPYNWEIVLRSGFGG